MSVTSMPQAGAKTGKQKKRKVSKRRFIVFVAVLAVAGGAWFTLLRPAPTQPAPGAVMALDAVQVNLAGGHYLKVGIALQLTDKVKEVDGSKALDATIALFSGLRLDALAQPVQRERLKDQLFATVKDLYEGEVMGVYFTNFVTQ